MTAMTEQTNAYQVAASTPDPELPMLTIEDLGILTISRPFASEQ